MFLPTIRIAQDADLDWLLKQDTHIPPDSLTQILALGRILIAEHQQQRLGWLRYGFFWDAIPFMNMLTIVETWRGKGIGSALAQTWEGQMKQNGHAMLLTSSYAHEQGQHFYRKHGYQDIGGFVLPGEPMEIIFMKVL